MKKDDAEWAKGILPRWHINWNITMLRLVSFNMDYYWAATAGTSVPTDDSADTKVFFRQLQMGVHTDERRGRRS